MDVTVQHRFRNIQHYKNCTTVKDLRDEIGKDTNYKCHTDLKDWKLFYLGVQLDDDEELKEIKPDLTEKPFIILEEPPDIPRWGISHPFITDDKTRFLVTGNRNDFNVSAIRPHDINSYDCPLEYYWAGDQKFGLITNVHRDGEERKVEIDVYQLPMNKTGWIMLWEDPKSKGDANRSPQVHLIIDQDRRRYDVLKPRALKTYIEKNMKSVNKNENKNTHMDEILKELEENGDQPTPPQPMDIEQPN